jgi:ATP-dependent Clp protease ATP-binding subunit ClpA
MFDSYSLRSKLVLFVARLESGARGAEMLDLDDLLTALIIEDQNGIPSAVARLGMTGELMAFPKHQPFLPPDTASSVLESIRESLPHSQAVPQSTDMPISSALQEALAAAIDVGKKLHSKEVTPLHLLAALMQTSQKGARALREAGITEEEVLRVIQKEEHE